MRFDRCRQGLLALSLASALAGCRSATVAEPPLTAQLAGNDVDAQMEFWHRLPERRMATNDEAFHALLLFVDGADPAADYAGRVDALKQRQMLPTDFNGAANGAVKRGTVAVMLVRALEIKGGLSMRLFGPTPRYAVRELQYMNLFPQSSPQQTFSGQELLGIIGRAEDYQRTFNEDALADSPATSDSQPPKS
jgi:hypothetical protein